MSSAIGFAVCLSACSNASSADQTSSTQISGTADIQTVTETTSGNWTIQPDSSHIRFTAKQEGVSFRGAFETFTGVINFDPSAPETGAVEITIPLAGVDAGSNDRNSTLPGKVWFSAKKFPNATFKSTDITREASAADGAYVAKGELSLKGTSVPLNLPFTLEIDGETAVMNAGLTLDRTLWNVGAAPWNTDEWVSRAVELDIQVTAKR